MDDGECVMKTLQIDATHVAEFVGTRPIIWGERWWKCGEIDMHPSEGLADEQIITTFRAALQEGGEL